MADIEPPSFSLGFDLDDDEPLPAIEDHSHPPLPSASSSKPSILDGDDRLGPEAMDSDPDTAPQPPRIFRRIRRGLPKPAPKRLDDDDIENFSSSDEDPIGDSVVPKELRTVNSSSKASLRASCVLAPKLSSLTKEGKKKPTIGVPTSRSTEAINKSPMFPDLTISPLRRFQLIDSDSDSDGPSGLLDTGGGVHRFDKYSTGLQSPVNDHPSSLKKPQSSTAKKDNVEGGADSRKEDPWRNFSPMNNIDIPTPAFDQVCKEYYQSLKNRSVTQEQTSQNLQQKWDLKGPLPSSHQYFFHGDIRIRNLVQARLPFFFPLGVLSAETNRQQSVSKIDYMDQFANREASTNKGHGEINSANGSTSRRKSSKRQKAEAASEEWINPKTSSGVPKNVGRRVEVKSQPNGHWYTSPEGKKVYVSSSGQELTGRMAYRHYQKESGAVIRKAKHKSKPKKRRTQK